MGKPAFPGAKAAGRRPAGLAFGGCPGGGERRRLLQTPWRKEKCRLGARVRALWRGWPQHHQESWGGLRALGACPHAAFAAHAEDSVGKGRQRARQRTVPPVPGTREPAPRSRCPPAQSSHVPLALGSLPCPQSRVPEWSRDREARGGVCPGPSLPPALTGPAVVTPGGGLPPKRAQPPPFLGLCLQRARAGRRPGSKWTRLPGRPCDSSARGRASEWAPMPARGGDGRLAGPISGARVAQQMPWSLAFDQRPLSCPPLCQRGGLPGKGPREVAASPSGTGPD